MAFTKSYRLERVYFERLKSMIDILKPYLNEETDEKLRAILENSIDDNGAILLLYRNLGECWAELSDLIKKADEKIDQTKKDADEYHDELNKRIDEVNNYIMQLIRELEVKIETLGGLIIHATTVNDEIVIDKSYAEIKEVLDKGNAVYLYYFLEIPPLGPFPARKIYNFYQYDGTNEDESHLFKMMNFDITGAESIDFSKNTIEIMSDDTINYFTSAATLVNRGPGINILFDVTGESTINSYAIYSGGIGTGGVIETFADTYANSDVNVIDNGKKVFLREHANYTVSGNDISRVFLIDEDYDPLYTGLVQLLNRTTEKFLLTITETVKVKIALSETLTCTRKVIYYIDENGSAQSYVKLSNSTDFPDSFVIPYTNERALKGYDTRNESVEKTMLLEIDSTVNTSNLSKAILETVLTNYLPIKSVRYTGV